MLGNMYLECVDSSLKVFIVLKLVLRFYGIALQIKTID